MSGAIANTTAPCRRLRLEIHGTVQGVGFRPFVYRLAKELNLPGWVLNGGHGVTIEVEGPAATLERFRSRLIEERPSLSAIHSLEAVELDPVGLPSFEIRESVADSAPTALVLPDIATCADCLRETLDPRDRRYRYPFTNCTNCGPRYSIIEALPYDRPRTTMRSFPMCALCRAEFEDPGNRRFHAQPIACPECGPQVGLWDARGVVVAARHDALVRTAAAIREGLVVAVKGLGGFHLVCAAASDAAVRRLRRAKRREEKPFALMYPDVDEVGRACRVSEREALLLDSPAAPIVLLDRLEGVAAVADSVAPDSSTLGILLPATPLHHLLLAEVGAPIVATSGNLSEEPICTDEHETLERLANVADLFLVHDRPIARHVDDSIVRIAAGREIVLRRARGYAPLPVRVGFDLPPVLAVGGHLKSTVAISRGREVHLSQHLGDLETLEARHAFEHAVESLSRLYAHRPCAVACDEHPDYFSTAFAERLGLPILRIQHHHAHVLACAAENQVDGPVLGVSWDGSGRGPDGTVWGGEFLRTDGAAFERVAALRRFRLPGGEQAVREPRRSAVGVLFEMFGERAFALDELAPIRAFASSERSVVLRMLQRGLNAPQTSSAGRLFDAVASLTGLQQVSTFEGQAAMAVERAAERSDDPGTYTVELHDRVLGWEPLMRGILDDLRCGTAASAIARRFHNALADAIVLVAEHAGEARVVLSGGCFQNRVLLETTVTRLRRAGFEPCWHQRVPPNDGGVALGQIVAAARRLERSDA